MEKQKFIGIKRKLKTKIVLLGDVSVGKTSLAHRYIETDFIGFRKMRCLRMSLRLLVLSSSQSPFKKPMQRCSLIYGILLVRRDSSLWADFTTRMLKEPS